ncbi:hypothetical protein [Paraburkholderia saeva]|uniref:Uncharacterized protein n=1 Tax=Paraburkholderia saeva TaxID=2777537 RepID=A0A9N8S3B2_9BURK|nr:hypothetical protein [Paraburkholderia saeva]CAG4928261.1 hypothetical protein LMG31841_05797 [Paraburkholderia saeva]
MQQFDITVANTGAFPVHAPGRYIKYVAGSNGGGDASLIVTPGGQGGSKIVLQPGQAYRVAESKPTPDSWTLANSAGGATIIGKVVIGDGRIDDNTFSGVVQTVDGGKVRTLAGASFIGMNLTAAPGAGQFQHVQLWNPAGSGKRLVVEQIETVSSVGVGFTHYATTAAISTLNGYGVSKLFGAPASAAGLLYKQNNATLLWTAAEMLTNGPINTTSLFKPAEPFVIPPGYGWGIIAQATNADLTATWEWYEEPNT